MENPVTVIYAILYDLVLLNLLNSKNSRLGSEAKERIQTNMDSENRRRFGWENGVALTTFKSGLDSELFFLSQNTMMSAKSVKPSAQRGRRFKRSYKHAKSTIFRILTKINIQVYQNRIGPSQIHPS